MSDGQHHPPEGIPVPSARSLSAAERRLAEEIAELRGRLIAAERRLAALERWREQGAPHEGGILLDVVRDLEAEYGVPAAEWEPEPLTPADVAHVEAALERERGGKQDA